MLPGWQLPKARWIIMQRVYIPSRKKGPQPRKASEQLFKGGGTPLRTPKYLLLLHAGQKDTLCFNNYSLGGHFVANLSTWSPSLLNEEGAQRHLGVEDTLPALLTAGIREPRALRFHAFVQGHTVDSWSPAQHSVLSLTRMPLDNP